MQAYSPRGDRGCGDRCLRGGKSCDQQFNDGTLVELLWVQQFTDQQFNDGTLVQLLWVQQFTDQQFNDGTRMQLL